MTSSIRQNNLLLNQDWKRIYQTFKNADFKSYDFENIRRVIITYLRENYPEDFNDYIESSEYMALIDAMAFVGQSLAFRIDLNSRENFIELAETKASVLRLARLISYNAKRNIGASGLLKFDTISTTEDIIDSNGKNLSQQIIIWNDPTNPNWFEHFLLILNSAMSDSTEFGRSQGSSTIQGINSEQYRFRSSFIDVPLFNFEKTVANRRATFEIVSTSFLGQEFFYEESPLPGRELGFVYRNDGKGASSVNTGFFMLLKQGSLEITDFEIEVPSTNEIVTVDVENINNDDVWLWKINSQGNQIEEWTKVPELSGNNIAYNSLSADVRNIYAVLSKESDKIDIAFADGIYGNLPKGLFRTYYRVSNGLSYSISPAEMRGINISIPYTNKLGSTHELLISLSLKTSINNAAESEDIDSIRNRAPAIYYTQNRMVTGEDYNLAPLVSSQDIVKVKSINRTSSGISRNFEIIDATGKYSSVNIFADDGYIYREETEKLLSFRYTNRIDIVNYLRNTIENELSKASTFNFYLTKFDKILFTDQNVRWTSVDNEINQTTGYFINPVDNSLFKVGIYTSNTLKYIFSGAMIKFVPPEGKAFKNGTIVDIIEDDIDQTAYIWSKIVKVTGDGTNAGRGVLSNGQGPVILNENVPTGSIASEIVPRFINRLSNELQTEIINIISSNLSFGIRYDQDSGSWKIITSGNLNTVNFFSLGSAGDVSNTNLDTSWIVAFIRQPESFEVKIRGVDYVFGSIEQNRFYFDVNQKTYDSKTNRVIKDIIKVLGVNSNKNRLGPLINDIVFEISDTIKYEDGYESSKELKLAFSDQDSDGIIDNPDAFDLIVSPNPNLRYLFFQKFVDSEGNVDFNFIDTTIQPIYVEETRINLNLNNYQNNDLIYFYSEAENIVMKVNKVNNILEFLPDYKAVVGRSSLKFQYFHNANVDRRIDPSTSNIVDIYLLTKTYDTEFRNYLSGAVLVKPEPPSNEFLKLNYGKELDKIKTISDELVYYPVSYKVLFGKTAEPYLQASFKVVKNSNKSINDNDLKVRIINSINSFFDISNWDFGDKFYLSELITYITNYTAPDISNMVIVPRQETQVFGSLFEIQSRSDEIFVSGATVDDIEIVNSINAIELNALPGTVVTSTN